MKAHTQSDHISKQEYLKALTRIALLEKQFEDMVFFLNDAIRMRKQAEIGKPDTSVDHLLP